MNFKICFPSIFFSEKQACRNYLKIYLSFKALGKFWSRFSFKWLSSHREIYICGIFVERFHDIFPGNSEKFLMESPGIFPNNVPGILNIGTFLECSMNILRMLHVFFRWIKKYNSSFLWWTRLFLIFTLRLWKSNFHRSLIIKAKVM